MKADCVCGCCGRTIDKEFLYCPWCGQEKMHDKKDSFEAIFKNLEEKQAEDRARRVVALEQKLDALDRDLSILALSVEMAK